MKVKNLDVKVTYYVGLSDIEVSEGKSGRFQGILPRAFQSRCGKQFRGVGRRSIEDFK